MKSSRILRATYLATSALGVLMSAAVSAHAADKDATMGDIIVTARRTEERLQDVPISITVFNQQKLTNANIVSSGDLARITPSLSVNNNFGNDNSSFAIRGFIQENGTAPSVGVYFADVVAPRAGSNGIPAGDGAGAGSFFDLQNVQVLKGPQGTLQGRNTTGGAVLLVPQKPTSRFEGYVEGSYGNYDMRRLQAVVNLPLNDAVRVRLGVDRQMRDGYEMNGSGIGPRALGNVNYTAFRGSIVIDILPNLENYTIGSLTHSDTYGDVQKAILGNGTGAGAPVGTNPPLFLGAITGGAGFYDVANAEEHPQSKLDTWQIINTTTWKPKDNLTVKNIISYAELKDDVTSTLFGVVQPFSYAPVAGYVPPGTFPTGTYPLPFTEVNHPAGMDDAHESTFTEELQFQGTNLDNRLTWQGGVYAEAALPIGTVGQQSGFLASCTNTQALQCTDPLGLESTVFAGGTYSPVATLNVTEGRTSFHDLGVYGQATYKLTDQFKLTAGYRYTWDHEEAVSYQTGTSIDFPPNYGLTPGTTRCTQVQTEPSCINHIYQHSNKPTWLIDLDYTPTEDILLYAKYSRGYRAGTIAPNVTAPLDVALPETVDSYEGGFKTTFHVPFKATADLSIFYNNFTNQQIQLGFNAPTNSGDASTAAPVNAGASRIYGAEFSGSIVPFEGLVIDVGYTYLNTKITKVTNFPSNLELPFVLSAPFQVGDPIVLTPTNKAVISATYTLPLASDLGKVSIGMTFTHTDRELANYADRTANNLVSSPLPAWNEPNLVQYGWIPATDLLDMAASWNNIMRSPVDLSVFGTNVTGVKYYTYAPGLATSGLGFETVELGQPTMFGVRLKYHFGR